MVANAEKKMRQPEQNRRGEMPKQKHSLRRARGQEPPGQGPGVARGAGTTLTGLQPVEEPTLEQSGEKQGAVAAKEPPGAEHHLLLKRDGRKGGRR